MLIETDPCEKCDCCPALCDGDIEICQMTMGDFAPVSQEEYDRREMERYIEIDRDACVAEICGGKRTYEHGNHVMVVDV